MAAATEGTGDVAEGDTMTIRQVIREGILSKRCRVSQSSMHYISAVGVHLHCSPHVCSGVGDLVTLN